jgi:hypothetical protein
MAMRKGCLEQKYGYVFPYRESLDEQEEEEPQETIPEEPRPESGRFSWVNVHRNLLGDAIQEEDRFLKLSVHTVLYRLNRVIQQERKRKK